MRAIFLAVIFAWAVLPGAPISAELPETGLPEEKISGGAALEDLLEYAYLANPSIRAGREGWRGVIERHRVETALPDPELNFAYFPRPFMTNFDLSLSQMIPFPGKLSKAGEVVEADIQAARLELSRALRDVGTAVRESYQELLYLREAKQTTSLTRDLLEHLRKLGEAAYTGERATLYDVLKSQSQLAQLQYDLLLLEDLEETEKVQMNALLGRPPEAPIRLLPPPPISPLAYEVGEMYALAEKNQEEIRLAETRIQKAKARMGLARYESLPSFRLGVSYSRGNRGEVPAEYRDLFGVQVGVSIPLWAGKNAGRLEEALAEIGQAQSVKEGRVNNSKAQIRALYFRARNAERLIRLYRDELLPQATRAMEVSETWFRERQGSFADLIETQAVYYNFRLALARAKADYGKYTARLEQWVGVNPTRRPEPEQREEGKGK
jgi:outer membrane protein, heavy metal efflux system